jgi:hypothetical protein
MDELDFAILVGVDDADIDRMILQKVRQMRVQCIFGAGLLRLMLETGLLDEHLRPIARQRIDESHAHIALADQIEASVLERMRDEAAA